MASFNRTFDCHSVCREVRYYHFCLLATQDETDVAGILTARSVQKGGYLYSSNRNNMAVGVNMTNESRI